MEKESSGGLSECRNLCVFHRKCLSVRRDFAKMGMVYVIFIVLFDIVCGYNLDIETRTVHSSETRSMFGYSVALHQDQGSFWLLVGAPREQTSQPGITRGGAVYRCPLDSNGFCQQIPFDQSGKSLCQRGNSIRHDGNHYRDIEEKSNQWFGASLYSSSNGIIVACAPRYVYFSTRLDKREPVGTCYISRPTSTDYEEYSPCRSQVDGMPMVTDQFNRQGYCQLGMSAVLTAQGRQLLIGAVGSFYWQGQVFNFNFEDGPGRYQATSEGRQKDDYSYMGYSSAVGNFDDDDVEDYAVGVPRGRQLHGKVVLYRQNLTIIDTLRGEQFGSYFGYSVAVTDLDGNGLDDVIVGAPLFSDYSTDNSYETGRVYLFYKDKVNMFTKKNKDVLDGHHSQSRFGLSVAAIGDIDYDGYNDIAIGAPYGGEDGRGIVYIYHGSMKGIITDVQQAIAAEDVLTGAETFGWALAGGVDMDNNQYPDILVGSPESNKAVFLRSRPVVRVTPTIRVHPQNISLDEQLKCVIGEGKDQIKVQCMNVYICLQYTGIGVPDTLEFEAKIKFDADKTDENIRMRYLSSSTQEESKMINAVKDKQECFVLFGYLSKNIRDKLAPIAVDYSFDIHESKPRNKRDVTPVLNQRSPTTVRAEASIMKNCGQDNICIPDLYVHAAHTIDDYTLGETKPIEILVFVENRGEDAFESMINITFPPGVSFSKITNKKYDIPMLLNYRDQNLSTIYWDLGNPLPAKSRTNFTLVVQPDGNINGSQNELVFVLSVNSSNSENSSDTRDNVAAVKIPLQQAANLIIGGKPQPEQFIYSDSDVRQHRESNMVGPIIQHKYELSNLGPSAAKTSIIKIQWPGQDENGLNLLFMEIMPLVSRSDISCMLLNDTVQTYASGDGPVVTKNQRNKREATSDQLESDNKNPEKRDVEKRSSNQLRRISCQEGVEGCTHIHCLVGEILPGQSVNITVTARMWTSTLINKKISEPFYFESKASAMVKEMPYDKMKIAASTLTVSKNEVLTYVNPERLHPKRKGIEPWIIGVAVAAGLLLLLLLIILLWWCGFFRRQRPEEKAYLIHGGAQPQNGEYKQVNPGPPDARYQYS